jgi:hypothetical protein
MHMAPQEVAREGPAALIISPLRVCFIIQKAKQFHATQVVTDDNQVAVLENYGDDPLRRELRAFIGSLSADEQIDLLALAWLGRGDGSAENWPAIRQEATRRHNHRTANSLSGMPILADYLEEGLYLLGYSSQESD